ncbi:GGDEF domain-containing protein [Lysobacteraceae bacterium NML93-0792]|nr:GGDEF domain-containing protein [Xanthomonadaceae bacterium NML93-0792]PBS17369.1 GGDEF domain-containing protein [Xanthomonadaceae bacterium NML93-0793]PBS20568.1 GGDEF domain-containing protein [Xanthomonadaceae bacterium NML93-0831]
MHTGTCPFHRDGPLRSPIALAVVMPEPARRGPLWVLLGWLVGGWLSTAQAQAPEVTPQLSLEMYGLDEGLSQLTVSAMSGDDQGFLWVATQDGLNRFDGHRFRTYRRHAEPGAPDPGLASSSIDSLAFEPGRTRMWLGTNDAGLEVVHLPTWTHYRLGPAQGLSHVRVTQLLLDPAGGAWLGTETGVDHVDADVTSARRLGATAEIVGLAWSEARSAPLALDSTCRLWAVGDAALTPLPGPAGAQRCMALQSGPEGLWVLADTGLHRLDADGRPARRWRLEIAGAGTAPTAMIRLEDGRVLVGFGNGDVLALRPGDARLQRLRFDRPPTSAITRFHQNGSGAWWIGTYTSGLYRVRPLAAVIRSDAAGTGTMDGWPSHSVRAVWRGGGGEMLIGTDSGLRRRSRVGAPWVGVPGLDGMSVRAVAPDADDGWWIGTLSGLWRLHADGRAARVDGLRDPRIDALLRVDDTLWVGTRGGLERLQAGRVVPDPVLAPLAGDMITTLVRDLDGTLLIASNTRGLWRLDGRRLARIEPGGAGLHASVWALHPDASAIWAGTFGAGLYRIDRATGASTALSERDGLTNNVVYRILPDAMDRLWVSTNLGLSVFDPASGIVQNIGRRDGLRNQEFNSGAGFADPGGLLYFGGTQGLDAIAPLQLPRRSAPARPVLTALQLLSRGSDDEARSQHETDIVYAPSITLGSEDSVFTIAMTAIDFLAPAAAQLRYRVHGLHGGWIYPHQARTEISLNHLPAGRYTLEVQAAGRDGEFGASRMLTIDMPPPLWRHPLAYALYGLLALLVLGLAVARTRQAVRREREQVDLLNRTVAERTAQLELANRQLQQSNVQLDAANRLDPLTHVANRRELQDWLTRESGRVVERLAGGGAETLLFFMLDIDAFKRVNDGHGHQAGDEVLVQFAQRLRTLCREGDLLVRWGGEEFVLVTRLGDADAAARLAERIRAAIAVEPMVLSHGAALSITCSIGFAPWPFSAAWPALGDWQQTSALADRCLYAAKAAGRNAWVGVVPGRAPDRWHLQALLAGADPHTLGDSVRVLHSGAEAPVFGL